ncbi:protein eva-1 homolog C [Lampris incognitus]|uniref:protein eva-1 homolog C n=1 Tax=Lampris incognitus TaxID=2546036 RepID=UPI0024B50A60|nr:protein eva-1 homolog C [Lampris incognitus]
MQAVKRTEGSRLSLFYLTLLLWTTRMNGLADFSNYLYRIISSHSALACDGQRLRLHCPRHATIHVQSAFYGARNRSCSACTALQKLLSECQGHRDCQLSVNHLLFGKDPCPGTPKYLHVDYKCKPTEHRTRVVCEGEMLLLRCKPPRLLNIYAAVYGRGLDQTDVCPAPHTRPPPFECLNHKAVHVVSQSCYSKQRCVVAVGNQTFRDPCFPGTRKYLTVLYACVPQTLFREADPDILRPSPSPEVEAEKVPPEDVMWPFPKGSRVPDPPGTILSTSLMIFGYIEEHPVTAALLFTSGVCIGLLLILLAVSVQVTCRGRPLRGRGPTAGSASRTNSHEEEDDDEDDGNEEGTDSSLLSATDRKSLYCWEEKTCMTEAAERAERIERREMVIQEIWMNSYLNGTSCSLN